MQGLAEYCLQIPAHLFYNLGEGMLRLCFNFQSVLIHNFLGSKYLGKSVTQARQQSKHSRDSASPGLILLQLPDFFDALKLGSPTVMEMTSSQSWVPRNLLSPALKHHTSTFLQNKLLFFGYDFPKRGHLQVLGYAAFVSGAVCSFAATTRDFPNVPVPIT